MSEAVRPVQMKPNGWATKANMQKAFNEKLASRQEEAQRRFDEDIANTEKFQRATYSAIGGTPLGFIGASPTHDGGIDFDFAEFTNVKANVALNREEALALMRGIQNWFDMRSNV